MLYNDYGARTYAVAIGLTEMPFPFFHFVLSVSFSESIYSMGVNVTWDDLAPAQAGVIQSGLEFSGR